MLLITGAVMTPSVNAKEKNFLVSLPLITLGYEGALRAEYSLRSRGFLAFDWAGWGSIEPREEMTTREMEEREGDSVTSEGEDYSVMYGRYDNPKNMSGFHWGIGAGVRRMKVLWLRTPEAGADKNALVLDENGKIHHNVRVAGNTYLGRIGYRHVGSDLGFMIGGYMVYKRFQRSLESLGSDSGDPFESPMQAMLKTI